MIKGVLSMFRRIMIPFLVFVALGAIATGIFYWVYDGYMYYRTDDAQVSGQVLNISAPAAGTLTTLSATVGETVSAGQVLGTITVPSAAGPTSAPATVNITSPIDGTIVQVPAVQGQGVAPGLQLATLTNLNILSITAYIDESAINN